MRKISIQDLKLFESIASLTQEELQKVLKNFLKKRYKKIYATKEYIIAFGDIPVGLVAHMDTVFDIPPTRFFFDEKKQTVWSPEGLGADDRAGVFMILKIIQCTNLRPTIIFTTDEEMGGLGAEALTNDYPSIPIDLNYLIQLDRRGVGEAVFYSCISEDFIEYILNFGFIEEWGTFSDISILCPAWNICGVNLSVGYADEHSYVETLNMNAFWQTYEKVINILKQKEHKKFKYKNEIAYLYNFYSNPYYSDSYRKQCNGCGKHFYDYEMIPVSKNNKIEYYCPDCSVQKVKWCNVCGTPITKGEICDSCKTKQIH